MTNALADILTGALTPRARAIESTGGDMQTPAEITALAERVERVLRNRHLVPDEPVHVRIGNRPADLGSLLGIWRAGAVAVPVHVSAAASTLERLQGLTHARFSVDGDQLDVSGEALPPHRPLLRDAALVIFTSGSTGMPKGVVIGHRRLARKLAALDRLLAFRPDDVVLLPLQLTFIFGIWVALLALMKGARLLLVPKFTIETIGTGLAQASILAGVPSMFRALLAESAPAAPNLRLLLTGGEVLAPKLARAMMDFTPAVIDLYGLTETGSCDFCAGPAEQPQDIGTIGRATEGVDFRIAESGELQIRTPFGMLGYLDDPAFTVASFADGFFRTGDLARVTEGGYVELIGRAKD
ncbi:MAG: long-chain fatty acid--CoA ligase, partial [Pseudolabrys sp.]